MIRPPEFSPVASLRLPRFGAARRRLGFLGGLVFLSVSLVAGPRALPPGAVPQDVRLEPPKDLDGYFPFQPAASEEEWSTRAEQVRRRILVSQGLWPSPERTPLNAVVHGRIERDGYTVEKVYFESMPGFFVTGNLYRPVGRTGRRPGVLCPHGHWNEGRFMDAGEEGVRKQIAQGAERFEEGGRSPLQARCVQLARMGCVVFHYDMIGYADSVQISQALAHGFAKQRPEMNAAEGWGLFSPQAESHLQSVMGLQTWNSVRALDFLTGLPDVDPERIGCTGASGGGTQTFLLGAIDSRVKVAFPAVMVSTAMQGGCTCENACLLRVGTGNVEFAALFAPRPLGLTTANDWTREMAAKGYPELQRHYGLLGASDKLMFERGEQFEHNYNQVSRAAMYRWFNRHLGLGQPEPVVEADYRRLTRQELSVWDDQHPKPAGGEEFERRLLRWWHEDAKRQLGEAAQSRARFREVAGAAMDVIIGRHVTEAGPASWTLKEKLDRQQVLEMTGVIRDPGRREELPALFFYPRNWNRQTVLWFSEQGKSVLYGDDGERPRPEVQRLLAAGIAVGGVDLLYQGEFLADGKPVTSTRRVKNPREAAAYTFGYNPTLFAQRVHDILTTVAFVRNYEMRSDRVSVIGLGPAGAWVTAARAQAGAAIDRAVVATGGFRFAGVREVHDPAFLPGGARYGDLPGMLALGAPGPTWVADETEESLRWARAMYASAGYPKALEIYRGPAGSMMEAALGWLLAP